MSSTATEATSSLRQNGQLAVRLSSVQSRGGPSPAVSPAGDQLSAELAARRKPKKTAIPRHPIPSMQEAFAESLAEVTSGTLSMKPKLRVDTPQIRRDRLLDQDKTEGPPAALWRLRPGQNCHELRKLLAQIAFGVYLLLKGMANSNAQVVAILQGHIDEVDEYLKTAMEDLNLATQDLNTRLDYLKLPLGNLPAFEEMLEDREFRLRIVEGNVRIEHILSRTTTSLVQTIDDVAEGLRSTKEFTTYLAVEEHGSWRVDRPEIADIYEAMRGNAEGWLTAFADLEEKTNTLDLLISKLADMVTDMDRCAGEVSRRTRFSIKPYTLPELNARLSHESQQSSFLSSHETTPPLSPGIQVAPMPPRISLRFSTLGDILTPNFLDLGSRDSVLGGDNALPTFQYTPPAENPKEVELRHAAGQAAALNSTQQQVQTSKDESAPVAKATKSSQKESEAAEKIPIGTRVLNVSENVEKPAEAGAEVDGDNKSPVSPQNDIDSAKDEPSPEAKEASADEATEEQEPKEEEPLYILQPRTYTPQPPAPLPSPRVIEHEHRDSFQYPRPRDGGASPRQYIPPVEDRLSYRGPSSPVTRTDNRPPRTAPSYAQPVQNSVAEKQSTIVSPSVSVSSGKTADGDGNSGVPRKRTSIRDRVSLRTTPPDAILVPPVNAPQLHRPVFASPRTYQNYQTFTGPDSARSSDAGRTASVTFSDAPVTNASGRGHGHNQSNSRDFSPPVFPVVPSPHSDQQYFRPVQASPHSPLQQRPHTAGQVPSRPYHLRNAPSQMGMSMLSSVTTMTQDSKGQPTLKKKRSAFGWLKKAFTLDEDERITFDQRRQTEERNLYYDGKSPKFLDGKRVR